MLYLLDTSVFLWLETDRRRLAAATLALLANPENTVLLSLASVWEITIKYAIGRLALPQRPEVYVSSRMALDRITPLAIRDEHVYRTGDLPRHHGDPFDRLLVAQAQVERACLVTADARILQYDVDTLAV